MRKSTTNDDYLSLVVCDGVATADYELSRDDAERIGHALLKAAAALAEEEKNSEKR